MGMDNVVEKKQSFSWRKSDAGIIYCFSKTTYRSIYMLIYVHEYITKIAP